jgi:3-methyladenine DNA glycosylase AlkD
MSDNIIAQIKEALKNNSDEKTKASTLHFFKEKIEYYGVASSTVQKIAKTFYPQIAHLSKEEIFDLCNQLWKSNMIEESFIACTWSYNLHKQYTTADYYRFQEWVDNYVNNWASCDTLCNHTIGKCVEMYPEHLTDLKKCAYSDNRWMRRAAAVSLIIPARKGKFLHDIFEIADILLLDKDDLVQKGYGWMLKAASETHQQEVFDFVVKNKSIMPRTALRYAIEKMPKELKVIAMQK